MLIEYKIKFEKHGVTITQRVEPGSPAAIVTGHPVIGSQAGSVELGDHFDAAKAASRPKLAAGTGHADPSDTGEGNTSSNGAGSGLAIIFGPIIVGGAGIGAIGGGNADPGDTGEGKPTMAADNGIKKI